MSPGKNIQQGVCLVKLTLNLSGFCFYLQDHAHVAAVLKVDFVTELNMDGFIHSWTSLSWKLKT